MMTVCVLGDLLAEPFCLRDALIFFIGPLLIFFGANGDKKIKSNG